MEKQLSLELKILSSGKQKNSSLKKHLSSEKEQKPEQKNQEKQSVSEQLPKKAKELKLSSDFLSLVETKKSLLSSTGLCQRLPPKVQDL